MDPDYEWHEIAKIWQTPERGEQLMTGFTGDGLRAMAEGNGLPADHSAVSAPLIDDHMKDCILQLYRSAVDVSSSEWGPSLTSAPSRSNACGIRRPDVSEPPRR